MLARSREYASLPDQQKRVEVDLAAPSPSPAPPRTRAATRTSVPASTRHSAIVAFSAGCFPLMTRHCSSMGVTVLQPIISNSSATVVVATTPLIVTVFRFR